MLDLLLKKEEICNEEKSVIAAAVLSATIFLSACTSAENEQTPPKLPGVPWGITTDQALESLGTDREKLGENLTVYEEGAGAATAILENQEVFGQTSEGLILYFSATKDGIYYPDNADMEKVGQEMEKAFGQPAEAMTIYGMDGKANTNSTGEKSRYWQGQLLQEVLDENQKIDLRQYVAHQGPNIREKIDDNQWEAYLKNPMATASWHTEYQNPQTEQLQENPGLKEYKNVVILDGSQQVQVDELS